MLRTFDGHEQTLARSLFYAFNYKLLVLLYLLIFGLDGSDNSQVPELVLVLLLNYGVKISSQLLTVAKRLSAR